MKPMTFGHANKTLQPSGKQYSADIVSVEPISIWTNDEQCVSCWKMSWRERLSAFLFGRVWIAVLSGDTQPPIYAQVSREYLENGS